MVTLSTPWVMGIVNVTPDSFYAASRTPAAGGVVERVEAMVAAGVDIVDVGAASTRPGARPLAAEEEVRRLAPALEAIRRRWPELLLSADTYHSSVAATCVGTFGVDMVNDISGGQYDPAMMATVGRLRVPYILMHAPAAEAGMHDSSPEADIVCAVARHLAARTQMAHDAGIADVVVDPGFGFGKTLRQNYRLMHHLAHLRQLFAQQAMLVGLSRKSMVYKLLDSTPEEALTGTTVLHTLALTAGADILRVHDVRAARDAVQVWQAVHREP